jgi:hypothetical protein
MKRLVIIDQMETCLAMAVHQFPFPKLKKKKHWKTVTLNVPQNNL